MRASPQSTPKPVRRPGQNGKDNLIPISDEQTKLAQEIVGAGRDAGGWLANIFGDIPRDTLGFLFGDEIKVKREENIIKLCAKAKKRLAEQGIEEPAPANPKLAVPILAAAADEQAAAAAFAQRSLPRVVAEPGYQFCPVLDLRLIKRDQLGFGYENYRGQRA